MSDEPTQPPCNDPQPTETQIAEEPETTKSPGEDRRVSSRRGRALGLKDWLGFILSTIAIIVSGLSLYLGSLRVEDNTFARLVDFEETSAKSDDKNADNSFLVAHIVFANAGNRPAVVFRVEYQLQGSAIAVASEVESDAGVFPLLLQPRDLRVVDLRIPVKSIIGNRKIGTPIDASAAEPRWSVDCAFHFLSVDSRGQLHDVTSVALLNIVVSNTGLSEFGPVKGRGLGEVSVSLFK